MKRKYKYLIIFSYIFLVLFSSIRTTQSDLNFGGKLAEDGTRLYFTYWNPFGQVVAPSGQVLYNGSEEIIYEGGTVTYQEVFVYFAFSNSTTKECLYNMTFYRTFYNETMEQYMTETDPYNNERRVVISQGSDYVKDTINMPIHQKPVYILFQYLNVKFGFFHITFEGVIPDEYTEYDMRMVALKNTAIVFCVIVLGGGAMAFGIVKKAGNFDLGWHWALIIPMIIFNGFLFYATYLYYVSLKELLYRFPYWAVIFVAFIMTVIIWINILNKVKGRNYIRCDKFDAKSMTVETYDIPVDKNETHYQEEGLKASCIRLISKGNHKYDQSIQFGTFKEVDIDHYETVVDNQDKITKKVNKLQQEEWIYKGAIASEQEGKKELHFIKTQVVFEPSEVVPRWFWTPRNRAFISKTYMVENIQHTRAKANLKSPWYIPSGIFCLFNLIFGFVYRNPDKTIDSALKVSLWIAFSIIILVTLGFQSTAGGFQIEVSESHKALGRISACSHLNQAELDAETIAQLKSDIEKLKTTRYIDALKEGERQSANYLDATIHYVENEIIPLLEEKENDQKR